MIRKAIIVVLTLATAVTLYAGYVGIGSPSALVRWGVWPEFPFEASGKYVTWTHSNATVDVMLRSGGGRLGIVWKRIVWKRYEQGTWSTSGSGWSWDLPLIRCEWRSETGLMGHPNSSLLRPGQLLSLLISAWLPAIVFSTYPAIAFVRGPLRRWRRRRKGFCIDCGYDLTGNVTGVCSECGTEVEQP